MRLTVVKQEDVIVPPVRLCRIQHQSQLLNEETGRYLIIAAFNELEPDVYFILVSPLH